MCFWALTRKLNKKSIDLVQEWIACVFLADGAVLVNDSDNSTATTAPSSCWEPAMEHTDGEEDRKRGNGLTNIRARRTITEHS